MTKSIVKRSVMQLQRDFGPVFPIAEIISANPEVSNEDVMKALEELKGEGLINILEDSIQVNV